MPDVSLVARNVASAPKAYVVPGAQEFELKAVTAAVDGTGASGSFQPVLQMVSPAGDIMWTAVGETVAAGGSAAVTWFPGAEVEEENALATAYVGVVDALGPWAFWKCADAAGSSTLADSSGHGRTLGLHASTATLGHAGLLSTTTTTCLSETLGGASNVEEAPSLATQTYTASVVSLEFWVNTAGNPGNDMFLACFDRLDAPHQTWAAYLNGSGNPVFSFIDAGSVTHASTFGFNAANSVTHQLVFTMDGTTVSFYLDGVLFGTNPAGAVLNVPNTATVCLGQPLGGVVTRWYGGLIGPAVVYDKVLSAAQVAQLYNSGSGASSGGAVASVTAGDTSIVTGGTATNVTLETASLDVIATDHPTAANWSNNSHKITSVTDPTNPQDVATKHYVDTSGGGAVSSVFGRTGAVVAVSNDYTLNQVGAATADYSINSHKLTNLTDPGAAQDAATKAYVDSAALTGGVWVKLASNTLAAPAATIDISGISGSYSHLRLYIQARSSSAGLTDNMNLTFNADSTANHYGWQFSFGGSFAQAFNDTKMEFQCLGTGASNASSMEPLVIDIPFYAGTNWFKNAESVGSFFDGTGSSFNLRVFSGTWRSTAAINEITFALGTGPNFVTNSQYVLYGIV